MRDTGDDDARRGPREGENARREGEPARQVLMRLSSVRARPGEAPACSFCGRGGTQVQVLIAGDQGYICDACVEVCRGLIATERGVEGA